jgi:hypothetical protein
MLLASIVNGFLRSFDFCSQRILICSFLTVFWVQYWVILSIGVLLSAEECWVLSKPSGIRHRKQLCDIGTVSSLYLELTGWSISPFPTTESIDVVELTPPS